MAILTPVIALGSLGLLFGLVLAFASKKFSVERDERVDLVRECLPGANCGACGFPGCDGLAAAIVQGSAPVNACPVGGAKCAGAVGGIMGVAVQPEERKIARVMCQGKHANTKDKYLYDGARDCQGAALYAEGQKDCRFACLGFGNCAKSCKFGAIKIEDGLCVIDPAKCIGCGVCEKACPHGVIRLLPASTAVLVRCRNTDTGKKVREVCAQGCLTCMRCKKACDIGAIEFANNVPRIDYGKCVKCGACAKVCAPRTITDLLHAYDSN